MVLSDFVKYWCIFHCHKCKMKYIELRMMKVVLIRVIIGKKVINIALKSEMGHSYFRTMFFYKRITY